MQDAHNTGYASTTLPYYQTTQRPIKQRKVDRACDTCRRRKSRCDGSKKPDNICSGCLTGQIQCTYVETSKPRGPPKAYITDLEDKLERLEAILQQVRPDTDFSEELGPPIIRDSWKAETIPHHAGDGHSPESPLFANASGSRQPPVSEGNIAKQNAASISVASLYPANLPATAISTHLTFEKQPFRQKKTSHKSVSSADDSDNDDLVESRVGGTHRLEINQITSVDDPLNYRFHGKSAHVNLVQAARKLKELRIQEGNAEEELQSGLPSPPPVSAYKRRPEFWTTPRWEIPHESPLDSMQELANTLKAFPPIDLAESLIEMYFMHTNSLFPLLHRPTFDRQWKEQLYHRSIWFSGVCLCIFAIASRWSNDPRVIPQDSSEKGDAKPNWATAGRSYFNATYDIHRIRRSLMHPACLFEIQSFSLMAMYIRGSSSYPIGWLLVNVGIRKAQDVGAHRRKVYSPEPNLEDELWKRAFWMLVGFDRYSSSALGRECGSAEEDFDLPPILEVDDEYLEDKSFKQPPGLPCKITAFNCWLRLTQTAAFATRTLYAISPHKVCPGPRVPWTISIVRQCQNALDVWQDSLPEYLKWEPNMPPVPVFSSQAMEIHSLFALAQVLIYQPFVPPPTGSKSPYFASNIQADFPFDAATICREAAVRCAKIVRQQMLEGGLSHTPLMILTSHACASTLMMEVWQMKGREREMQQRNLEDTKPLSATIDALLEDVYLFLHALKWVEPRWENATFYLSKLKECLLPDDDFFETKIAEPSAGYVQGRSPPFNMDPPSDCQIGNATEYRDNINVYQNPGHTVVYTPEVHGQYEQYAQPDLRPSPSSSNSTNLRRTSSMQRLAEQASMPTLHSSTAEHSYLSRSSSSSNLRHAPPIMHNPMEPPPSVPARPNTVPRLHFQYSQYGQGDDQYAPTMDQQHHNISDMRSLPAIYVEQEHEYAVYSGASSLRQVNNSWHEWQQMQPQQTQHSHHEQQPRHSQHLAATSSSNVQPPGQYYSQLVSNAVSPNPSYHYSSLYQL